MDPRLQDPRLQQPVRTDRSQQQQPRPDRAPRPPMPQPDPRQAAPRPRSTGTASTGQHPVARTRETSSGPTGTARIPIVRQTPAGPAAPRPGVRRPETNAPQPAVPTRSRLRTPPPAPPAPPRTTTAPLVPGAFETMRPASRPTPVQAFTPAAPARALPRPLPLPPTPLEVAAEPAPVRRRRGGRALISVLAVLGLMTLSALPAFASGALDEPPVAGIDVAGVQRLEVGADVTGAGVSADSVTGSLPVAAAPTWINPVRGRLNDGFGPRLARPVPGVSAFHRGQDITAPCGRPIRAAQAGVVTAARYWGSYGNWILIDGGDGVAVGYAHDSRIDVTVGQRVKAGQVIGLVGTTGASTGCHVHVEVQLNGIAVNPLTFFTARQVALGS